MSDNVEAHSGLFQFQWVWMRLSGVNRHKYGWCQPLRYMCVFCANSLCKNIVRLERAHAKNTCNKQNCSFSFREREQYVQCAAGICDDHTAAGSETQREIRKRRLIYNSQSILEQEDHWKWLFKLSIEVVVVSCLHFQLCLLASIIIFPNLEYPF